MSAFHSYESCLDNRSALLDAIVKMGYTPVENVTLHGYAGAKETADIAIRKAELPRAFGDIGFRRVPSGKFEIVMDDYDNNYHGYGKDWQARLQKTYLEEAQMATWKGLGYSHFEREVVKTAAGEKVIIRAQVPPQALPQEQMAGLGFRR